MPLPLFLPTIPSHLLGGRQCATTDQDGWRLSYMQHGLQGDQYTHSANITHSHSLSLFALPPSPKYRHPPPCSAFLKRPQTDRKGTAVGEEVETSRLPGNREKHRLHLLTGRQRLIDWRGHRKTTNHSLFAFPALASPFVTLQGLLICESLCIIYL